MRNSDKIFRDTDSAVNMVNKDEFVVAAARSGDMSVVKVQRAYKTLESVIPKLIAHYVTPEHTKDNPVTIKLFEGISLKAYYEPERVYKPNYADKPIIVPARIKVKADVTKSFNHKINASNS